jgi:hypothetical protein
MPAPFSDSFDFHLHQKSELQGNRSGWENPILAASLVDSPGPQRLEFFTEQLHYLKD